MLDFKKGIPLVHCITNYVTANDCANVIHAIGAKCVMADCSFEAQDITRRCSSLCINTGTLNQDRAKAMELSAKTAMENGIPILLDPVGVGSSLFRQKTVTQLLNDIKFSVIKGNISEIKAVYNNTCNNRGVDAPAQERENITEMVHIAKETAKKYSCVVIITGTTDIVSNGEKTFAIKNGHKLMGHISGSGCIHSAVVSTVLAQETDAFSAAVKGSVIMGICGELAAVRMAEKDGNASYKTYFIDSVYKITEKEIKEREKYELL